MPELIAELGVSPFISLCCREVFLAELSSSLISHACTPRSFGVLRSCSPLLPQAMSPWVASINDLDEHLLSKVLLVSIARYRNLFHGIENM